MKLITSKDKKKIIEQLNKQYGINEIPYQLIMFGKEKIRIFSGEIGRENLNIFDRELRIENAGLYIIKEESDGLRLTFDALSIFKNQITKNILEIDDKNAEEWLKGNDLQINADKGFKVLKNNHEFIGCGKSTGEKITNFVPKERRIK
jgi:NOL1/NOP2/fmu family ribosome biogenesis protein